jgi:hypothetical protein
VECFSIAKKHFSIKIDSVEGFFIALAQGSRFYGLLMTLRSSVCLLKNYLFDLLMAISSTLNAGILSIGPTSYVSYPRHSAIADIY